MREKRKRSKNFKGTKNDALVMFYARNDPNMDRTKLAEQLQKELKWDGLAPEIKVLKRMISGYRNKESIEEQSWSMATLKDFLVQPEALPAVLRVWKYRVEMKSDFTIREAKWVSRLYAVQKDTDKLSYWAGKYARTELMFEILGHPFDSTVLDRQLVKLPVGITSDFDSFLPFLAEQEDGIEQIRNLKQRKGVVELRFDTIDQASKVLTGEYTRESKGGTK